MSPVQRERIDQDKILRNSAAAPGPAARGNSPARPAAPGRRGSTTPAGLEGFEVSVVTSFSGAASLAADWADLHTRAATTNPYTHPRWMLTWAEHFVADANLFIVTVRRGSTLLGVAPFFWVRLGSSRRAVFRSLRLLGNGRVAQFTEIPGILADAAEHRAVFNAVVGFLQNEAVAWDWVKLTIDTQQGWFEPQWLTKVARAHSSFVVHQATRACVRVDLAGSWDEFLAARKRKNRESIRRGFHRLDRRVGDWSIDVVPEGPEFTSALNRIVELHRARSARTDKPNHPTMFGQSSAQAFYRDAIVAMAGAGQAEVSVLRCRGEMVAGLVALRANAQVYTHATGAAPEVWDFAPGTVLMAALARREMARGTTSLNLGAGPNRSKLSWSERLEFNHDFVIVGPRALSRARFGVYAQMGNAAALRRAGRYDTQDPG